MKLPFVILGVGAYRDLRLDLHEERGRVAELQAQLAASLAYERACLVSTSVVESLQQQLADERARTKELTDTIVRLKVSGATIREVGAGGPNGVRLPVREPSLFELEVDDNEHARNNPSLRRHLLTWADKEMKRPLRGEETEEDRREKVLNQLRGWDKVEAAPDEDEDDELDDDDDDLVTLG